MHDYGELVTLARAEVARAEQWWTHFEGAHLARPMVGLPHGRIEDVPTCIAAVWMRAHDGDAMLARLIDASNTDALAFDALCVIGARLDVQGGPVPDHLRGWRAARDIGAILRPRARKARPTARRDYCVWRSMESIAGVLRTGWPCDATPTRNIIHGPNCGDGDSVGDAVGEAWNCEHDAETVAYKSVEGVWTRWGGRPRGAWEFVLKESD